MPKFVTIGYGDQIGYESTKPSVRDAAHAFDSELLKSGILMGKAGNPVQLRNHDASRRVTKDGPYMSSPLPIAGFAIIEAANMAEAIKIVSHVPCSVAHGVVEVWPLDQTL